MAATADDILKLALELGPIERAELIERLLTSFEFPERERLDALWRSEAEERVEAYERGELRSVPAETVFSRLSQTPVDEG